MKRSFTVPGCCKALCIITNREENPNPFLAHGHKNTLTQAVQRTFRDYVLDTYTDRDEEKQRLKQGQWRE
jgi:hypothetical protein